MILLDTNAILWLLAGHRRAAPLTGTGLRLRLSPVSLLELKYLVEAGRVKVAEGRSVRSVAEDPRWEPDSPSSTALFEAALDVEWTRDPFDRLLTAHALCRGWRIASGDRELAANLPADRILVL